MGAYYTIREAMGLVTYEATGFGYILARANDKLNYRCVLGFKVLSPGSSKRCEFKIVKRLRKRRVKPFGIVDYYVPTVSFRCGRKATVGVLMEIRGKKFMIYLCPEHFKKFLDNMVKYVEEKAERAYKLIMETVSEVNPLADVEEVSEFFQSRSVG
jgi:hypothetical protein